MSRALPAWAQEIVPVDMDEAAILLGISRRSLVDVIGKHKHYEPRGNRKVFYPEHIALLRKALKCPTNSNLNAAKAAASSTPLEPSTESAYERALKLAMRPKPNGNARSSGQNTGNVVRLARKRFAHSRKPH